MQESEVTDTCVSNCSGNARHNIQQQRAHSKRELLVELDGKTERRAEKKTHTNISLENKLKFGQISWSLNLS